MYKVKILSVGKHKEPWLQEALDLYTARLKGQMGLEWTLVKDDAHLNELLLKEKAFICLSPEKKQFTSESFASFLQEALLKGGSRLSFAIGGADGFSKAVKEKAGLLISLSPLTFTHQITRLILLEQLYRALEIHKGSSYHK